MGILKRKNKNKEAKVVVTNLPKTTISGPSSTGGVITGTSKDIVKTISGGSSRRGTVKQELLPPKKVSSMIIKDSFRVGNQEQSLRQIQLKRIQQIAQEKLRAQQIQINRMREAQIKRLKESSGRAADFISGGGLTKRFIRKDQESLNKQIQNYNENYGRKELSGSEYQNALIEKAMIEEKQRLINQRKIDLDNSSAKKFGNFFNGKNLEVLKSNKKNIVMKEKEVQNIRNKINKRRSKGKQPTKTQQRILNISEEELKILKSGEDLTLKFDKGEAATFLIPVENPYVLSKATKIKFIGKQTQIGDKIITDVLFVTNNGERVGIAKGITLLRDGKGYTVVGGSSGRTGVSFPYAKVKMKSIRSFVEEGFSTTKPSKGKIKQTIKLLNSKKAKGEINILGKNIDFLIQKGIGNVATVKGKRFYHTGVEFPSAKFIKRKVPGIQKDKFATISSILTKDDLSKIIGETITVKGNKAEFIGFIKGESKLSKGYKISGNLKAQYSSALKKIISTIAAAESKASQLKILPNSKFAASLITANIIKNNLRYPGIGTISPKTIPPRRISNINSTNAKTITNSKSVTTPRISNRSGSRTITRSKSKVVEMSKGKQKQNPSQKLSQQTKLRLKLKQAQKLSQPQKSLLNNLRVPQSSNRSMGKSSSLPKFKINKAKTKKRVISGLNGYNVYIKSSGRIIKANKLPLSLNDALDRRAYIIDNSTSVSAPALKPVSNVKRLGTIFSKEKGARFKIKARTYKITKGKRMSIGGAIIEKKGKPRINTRGEKNGLNAARIIRQLYKPKKKIVKKRRKNGKR